VSSAVVARTVAVVRGKSTSSKTGCSTCGKASTSVRIIMARLLRGVAALGEVPGGLKSRDRVLGCTLSCRGVLASGCVTVSVVIVAAGSSVGTASSSSGKRSSLGMMLILVMLMLSSRLLVVLVSVEESAKLTFLLGLIVMLVLLMVGLLVRVLVRVLVVLTKQRERSTLMLLMLSLIGGLITRGLLVVPLAKLVCSKSSAASSASTSDTLSEARSRCSIVGVLLGVGL
jgi:ribosomal protein S14